MKKKGFTLIELLAVIVVLSIIITIAGTNAVRIKKEANKKEAKELERMLGTVGEALYSYEKINNPDGKFMSKWNECASQLEDDMQIFYITVKELKNAGYLKNFKNPASANDCDGYLKINAKNATFKPYISCEPYTDYKTISYMGHVTSLYYCINKWQESSC